MNSGIFPKIKCSICGFSNTIYTNQESIICKHCENKIDIIPYRFEKENSSGLFN